MKKFQACCFFLCSLIAAYSQNINTYKSLDPSAPIVFAGSYIVYKGDTVVLGPKAIFIDGQFSDNINARYPFVFNSINNAAKHLSNGSESSPMTLYIAPYVYWIDNPDDEAVREGENGLPPYGLVISCEWLKFRGLTEDPSNVVLACNRGQTIGAKGNFTMLRFIGDGTSSENITFGNYCNVDLDYPLKPQLSRKKRASAIVQAQLIHCNGDKILARNTRFISRLNLCPFVGAKRALFDRCHFESTDDALCATGVYLHCDLDFYASKPFYRTTGTGAVFLDCDITSHTQGQQYFTKANGQLTVVDTRIRTNTGTYIGWNDDMPEQARNYQCEVSQNGKPVFVGTKDPASTIDLSGKQLLYAYRVMHDNKPVYNSYNLLRGDDDWDPMGVKKLVVDAGNADKADYTKIPVQLRILPASADIETNKNNVTLTASMMRFGNYAFTGNAIKWRVAKPNEALVALEVSVNGETCTVVPGNNGDETKKVIIVAYTDAGLEAASEISVAPAMLTAPSFVRKPALISVGSGSIHVAYQLDTKFKDQSVINWYRCTDANGSNAIEVAVSRFNEPMTDYMLSAGDVGYYIMATVSPKHIRSPKGQAVQIVSAKPISAKEIKTDAKTLKTDFKNVSLKNQSQAIPGFWTWNHLIIASNERRFVLDTAKDAWYYGEGSDGAAGMTGLLQARSAVMRYTAVGEQFGDMQLTMIVVPFKTAGQAFSVAPLYMDVLIKFDTKTLTGYALRFIRTTKYHDAVDCMFVRYDHGEITAIGEPVSTSVLRGVCTINISATGNLINAKVTTTAEPRTEGSTVLPAVDISTSITSNKFGGFGIHYNGGSPTMIKELSAQWK